MDKKDTKDMTTSELLRCAAQSIKETTYGSSGNAVNILRKMVGSKETSSYGFDLAKALEVIADKIDDEIQVIRRDAVKKSRKPVGWFRIAIRQGEDYPEPRDCEKFGEYLNRCFILRPRDESGEPVQFGDNDITWKTPQGVDALPNQWFKVSAVDCEGYVFATTDDHEIVAVARMDENGHIKRRDLKVLGADGKPVKEGETVWDTESGKELYVCAIANADAKMIQCSDDTGDCEDYDAHHLTHIQPDTQDRIDKDARKDAITYWGCAKCSCLNCKAKIDGMTPRDWFRVINCEKDMRLDLLRRQRELDAHIVKKCFGDELSLNESVKHIDSIASKKILEHDKKTISRDMAGE